ncbi:5-bromo-4-chloroindolyl phosphate hydrolysis family protein [Ktedonospora formicarum]|uniref:5-bromo-4-chloroindolyl phosphate hydrolysis protein n=1 Tax=Ktedonospora formicarum TaxID=2778364 RepID=A0A8J3HQY2_9CHLR|nr:5-bromo-4-chloroindolyl phosphate hydrolysis family protein [Ktedonospora formicarum]GHO41969.1 hypothetical protein KSX_01320 [Ktedonospora formicarum]
MKIERYATLIALGIGVAVFLIAYFLLTSVGWSLWIAIGIAAISCLCISGASWLLLDRRSEREIHFDTYLDEAEQKVRIVQLKLRQIKAFAAKLRHQATAALLNQICYDVDQLITRIRAKNATELLSSAERVDNYLKQVVSVTEKYVDIEVYPRYYKEPNIKLEQIRQGLQSFDEYVVASAIALEEGDAFALDVDVQMLDAAKYRRLT